MIRPVSAIVIMGVSGCGKSTLGSLLAAATGFRFVEGDTLHSPDNISKMSTGVALTDADRWPWLEHVACELNDPALSKGCIVSCSALKRVYRDYIRANVHVPLVFVLPETPKPILLQRLQARPGHYMPPSLLDSQMATFERPEPDEMVFCLDGLQAPDILTAEVEAFLASYNGKDLRSEATNRVNGRQRSNQI